MATLHEHLSEQFQKWEVLGRGWQVYAGPVSLEPPFAPLVYRPLTDLPIEDDGRSHTFFSSLIERFNRKSSAQTLPTGPEPDSEPEPTPLERESQVEFQLTMPSDWDAAQHFQEQFFQNISLCNEPVAFELIGTGSRVTAQFVAAETDARLVRRQLMAHFPEVPLREQRDTLANAFETTNGDYAFAIELGLQHEFMLTLPARKLDPFVGIVAALAGIEPDEFALFQILWQPTQCPWAEALMSAVSSADGKPLFINHPELFNAAEKKTAKPLYAVVVRIMARTASRDRLQEIAQDLASALKVYCEPGANALIPLHNDDYPFDEHIADVLLRQSRRPGMLLNVDELAGFAHLPSSAVRSPAFARDAGKTKAAPDTVRKSPGIVIGDNEHNGETVPAFLTAEQRVRHVHIIGSSGTGKSSLLFNMIRQDIENGDGVGVLDPHGDLVDQILGIIPDGRIKDVVLVDPSDTEFPIGFNILQAHDDDEKILLASDLIAVFRRLATSWGDQMDTVLQNAILAFLNSTKGGTLSDLRLFLLDTKGTQFRKEFLETVTDPEVFFFWENIFPELTGGKSVGPVLSRLQDFFSRKPLRNMVGQLENKLDFADIMDSGKIFLARLPEGCGEENSYLLGTLMVSKFQQLTMARHTQAESARRNFWLYIDEFDHFITPTMTKILKGARKYRLGLTLAHQELHQLHSDPQVASAVMTQPGTRIVFKVGDGDAKQLGEGFESFDAKSLKNLPKYQAVVRVDRNDFDFSLILRKPEYPDQAEALAQREMAKTASRERYGTPREKVESEILGRIWGRKPEKTPPDASQPRKPASPPKATPEPQTEATKPDALPPTFVDPAEVLITSPASVAVTPSALPTTSSEPVVETKVSTAKPLPEPAMPKSASVRAEPEHPSEKVSKLPGKGMAWHKRTQERLTTEGKKLGFSAETEKQLASGSKQSADVLLRLGHVSIAIEIGSSGSTINHEFENIEKCLGRGFTRVAAVAAGKKFLGELEAAVLAALGKEKAATVGYYTPDELIEEMRRLAGTVEKPPENQPLASKGKRHGISVERVFPKGSSEDNKANQRVIHEIVTKILANPDAPAGS